MRETNCRPDLQKLEILPTILVVCFISEYLEHDVKFAYEVEHQLIEMINETIPTVTKFKYFAVQHNTKTSKTCYICVDTN